MMGLMMFVAKNPEIAAKLGLIGTKSKLFGQNDWNGYLGLIIQTITSLGLIGFGFVSSWVFGREYSDRTIKDILALPVPRSSIVISKFLVIFLWCILLSLILFFVSIFIGLMMHIPGWTVQVFFDLSHKFFITTFLTLFLCPPVAFFAGYSRGIIGPLGFVIITLVMAQFIGLVGLGPFFPWAIPGVYTASADIEGMQLFPVSYIILILTSALGFIGTILWWRFADLH